MALPSTYDAAVASELVAMRNALGIRPRALNQVAVVGDSWAAAVSLNPSGGFRGAGSGINWAEALSLGRFDIIAALGVSGKRTDEIGDQIAAAKLTKAGLLYLSCQMANDVSQQYPTAGTSGATGAANLIAHCEGWIDIGGIVILELPIGASGMATAMLSQINEARQRLREYAARNAAVYLHDAQPALFAPGDPALAWKTNYNYDATHINGRGAYYHGKSLLAVINSILPPRFEGVYNAIDVVGNGRWQLLPNPVFRTTSGGTTGAGVTGTVPGSCATSRSGAATLAVSVNAETENSGQKVSLAATFTAQGETVRLTSDVSLANWNPGEIVQGVALVSVSSPVALQSVYPQLTAFGDGASVENGSLFPMTTIPAMYYGPDEPYKVLLRTPPLVIPNYTTKGYLSMTVRASAQAAGSVNVDVFNMSVRRRLAV